MNIDQNQLEPGVAYMPDEENPALASIAVSMKRIADAFDKFVSMAEGDLSDEASES